MIYISQGSKESISLEILQKALQCLSLVERSKFCLVADPKTTPTGLRKLVQIQWEAPKEAHLVNSSQLSLETAIKLCLGSKNTKLLTLPLTKNELIINGTHAGGHTSFFKSYFRIDDLAMLFMHQNWRVLLLTDHVPLKEMPTQLCEELILNKIEKYILFSPTTKNFIFSGVNPHAGEDGILGSEERIIINSINVLKKKYPDKNFLGPVAGDSIYLCYPASKNAQLYIFPQHDQGLQTFKTLQQFWGIHITLGLPFARYSVDHGTGYKIIHQDSAYYLGLLYLMRYLLHE